MQANIEAYVEEQALITDFGTFWEIAAGHADGYSTAIDFTTTSVVNLKNELEALTTVFNEQNVVINENGVLLDEETQALLRYLATLDALEESLANVERGLDAHNAALVNPAISDAVDSLRAYNAVLSDTGVEYRSVEEISQDVTQSIRDQESAFEDLRDDVDAAEISLDDIDATMQEIKETIDDTGEGFRDLGDVIEQEIEDSKQFVEELDLALENDLTPATEKLAAAFQKIGITLSDPNFLGGFLDLLASANSELADLADSANNLISAAASGDGIAFLANIPGLVDSLNDLQNNPNLTTEARADRAFDVIGQIQDSDLSASQQQDLIAPIQEYIRELLTRSILSAPQALSPALIAQHESFAGTRGLDFNFGESRQALGLGDTGFQTPFELPEIDLSGVISQLAELARLGESAKQRRGTGETTAATGTGGGTSTAGRSTAQATQPTGVNRCSIRLYPIVRVRSGRVWLRSSAQCVCQDSTRQRSHTPL